MHARTLIRMTAVAALCLLGAAARVDAAGCSVSTSPVVFGTYNVFTTSPTDSTGTIVYRCNGNVDTVLITITKGQNNTYAPRALKKSGSGNDELPYNLYRDAARTSVWGDYTGGTTGLIDTDIPNNRDQTAIIYGRIPAQQDISAGSYSDSVSVVVNF